MLSAALTDVYDAQLPGLSPERVAAKLRMTMTDIARIADVHRNTLARAPGSAKVQGRLGDVMRVLADAAELLGGDQGRAVVWFRHQPLAGFDGQTAEELVSTGHTDAVRMHLRMLRDGGYA
jgi:hypothetical protein